MRGTDLKTTGGQAEDNLKAGGVVRESVPGDSRGTIAGSGCRGTSLIRNRPHPGPYIRFMYRALWWS